MMFRIKLHEEVVKFLRETGTVWRSPEFPESFVVNASWYKPTDEPGVYTVEFLRPEQPE